MIRKTIIGPMAALMISKMTNDASLTAEEQKDLEIPIAPRAVPRIPLGQITGLGMDDGKPYRQPPVHLNQRQRRKLARQSPHSKYARK